MTDAAGKQTTIGYDNVGNQTQMTDALLHTTTFTYDRLGRRTLTTYPDLSTDLGGVLGNACLPASFATIDEFNLGRWIIIPLGR